MEVAKTVEIELKNGQLLTLEMTPDLIRNIKNTFMLDSEDQITERHVKYFLTSALKNMLEAQE